MSRVGHDRHRELAGHPPAVLISILNRVVNGAVEQRLAAAGFGDIRASQDAVFEMIDPGGSRVSDMARRAGITKQAMSEQVAYLERRGYVVRAPDPADGRARIVTFTPRGRAAVDEAVAAVRDLEARWAGRLGKRRAGELRVALVELVAGFGMEHVRLPPGGPG